MELFKEKKKSRRKKKQEKQNVSDQNPEVKLTTNSPKGCSSKVSLDIGGSSPKDKGVGSTIEQSPILENSKDKKKNKNSKKGNSILSKGRNENICEKDKNELLNGVNKVKGEEKNDMIQGHNLTVNDDSNSSGPPGFNQSSTQPEQPSVPPRQFIHVTCEASMKPTTAAAKRFISIYYQTLTNGHTKDLCSYYHLSSQKSISVGGAHSVVTGLDNISMQIASLSGCLFNVRGVVAQDAANGGAHLLISGVCTPKGGFVTAFAHSVGLARIDEENIADSNSNSNSKTDTNSLISAKFVIQNDALSLLNGEMAFAVEQQNQQQMSQHDSFLAENNGIHQHQSEIGRHLYAGSQQSSSLLKPPGLFG